MNTETALITGSSSGIGFHLAHELARHGHPLVLVAPVQSELEDVARKMKSEHGVNVTVIAKDLEGHESLQSNRSMSERAGEDVEPEPCCGLTGFPRIPLILLLSSTVR